MTVYGSVEYPCPAHTGDECGLCAGHGVVQVETRALAYRHYDKWPTVELDRLEARDPRDGKWKHLEDVVPPARVEDAMGRLCEYEGSYGGAS